MQLVWAAAAVVAGAYVSAVLVGVGLRGISALLRRRASRRSPRSSDPSLAGQLDRPEDFVNDPELDTAGPEFGSGSELLADLIVLRHSDEIPAELRADMVEGRWWNIRGHRLSYLRCPLQDGSIAVASPSGTFEVDAAGRVAEVWELSLTEHA